MDTRLLVIPLAAIALALTTGPAGGAARTSKLSLHASATGALRFNVKRLTARHGTVKLVLKNPSGSGLDHAIAIEGKHIDKDGMTVGPGGTSVVSAKLKPGRYKFYCPVPGHEDAGMKGTLVVR